MHEMKFP